MGERRWLASIALAASIFAGGAVAEEPAAERLSDDTATPITLRLKNESPAKAFERLGQLANVHFPEPQDGWPAGGPVSIDAAAKPYWEVLSQVCAQSGVRCDRFWRGDVILMPDDGEWKNRPVHFDGPFRVDAASVDTRQAVFLSRTPQTKFSCLLTLNVQAEPRLTLVTSEYPIIGKFLDDNGEAIAWTHPSGTLVNTQLFHNKAILSIGFEPKPGIRKISLISGALPLYVQTEMSMLEIDDIAEAREKQADAAKLKFSVTTQKPDDGYDVTVRMIGSTRTERARYANLRQRAMFDAPRLIDEKGRDYTAIACQTTRDSITVNYRPVRNFKRLELGPAKKLTWIIPGGWHTVMAPFEFKDIALP